MIAAYNGLTKLSLLAADLSILKNSVRFPDIPKLSYPDFSETFSTLKQAQAALAQSIGTVSMMSRTIANALPDFSSSLRQLVETVALSQEPCVSTLTVEIQSAVEETLRAGWQYMNDDQRSAIDEIDPCILSPSEERSTSRLKLSFAEMLMIISILISLASIIIQLLPDAQLDEIIEQNAIAIEQQEALIAQNDEKLSLLRQINETSQKLLDCIDQLDDPADYAADVGEILVDSPSSDDAGTSQDDDADINCD